MTDEIEEAVGRVTVDREQMREAVRAWVREDLDTGAKMLVGFYGPKLIARLDALSLLPSASVQLEEVSLGSSGNDLGRGSTGAVEALSQPAWRCTRCGRNEIDCRENGCPRGPCPMEPTR